MAAKCRARVEAKLELARFEFAQPPLLSDEEIEDILGKLDDLTKWANEITAYAQDAAINHGKEWRGFKLVESRTNRRYTDENAVAQAAKGPVVFNPSHTLVLYTNHLPKVGAIDSGTWHRLIVVPFNAHIVGKNDIPLTIWMHSPVFPSKQ